MNEDLNLNQLKYAVYINNTESIEVAKKLNTNHYMSVCSGLKTLYKAAIDWYPGKKFKFTYFDIVPTAIEFRKFFDLKCNIYSMSEILKQFSSSNTIYPVVYGGEIEDIDNIIIDELKRLNLYHNWNSFLNEYYLAPKEYININIVKEVDVLKKNILDDDIIWLWFSNCFRWHQFKYSKEIFDNWINEFKNYDIKLSGRWIK